MTPWRCSSLIVGGRTVYETTAIGLDSLGLIGAEAVFEAYSSGRYMRRMTVVVVVVFAADVTLHQGTINFLRPSEICTHACQRERPLEISLRRKKKKGKKINILVSTRLAAKSGFPLLCLLEGRGWGLPRFALLWRNCTDNISIYFVSVFVFALFYFQPHLLSELPPIYFHSHSHSQRQRHLPPAYCLPSHRRTPLEMKKKQRNTPACTGSIWHSSIHPHGLPGRRHRFSSRRSVVTRRVVKSSFNFAKCQGSPYKK